MTFERKTFTVRPEDVRAMRQFVTGAVELAWSLSFAVRAEDFPVWCAALGVHSFHAIRSRDGVTLVSTQQTMPSIAHDLALVYVRCDRPPAGWVKFPEREGNCRYLFHYVEEKDSHDQL